MLGERFDLSRMEEATIEYDGEVLLEDLASLVETGFDRISIGIKSFKPGIRDLLGTGCLRLPDPVSAARDAGFSSVSLDLVYGLEGQSLEDLVSDLDLV